MAIKEMAPAGVSTPADLILSTHPERVRRLLQALESFRMMVASELRPNQDYGIIAGKQVLYKSGAEKIAMLLGLSIHFEIIEAVRDYEKGFFAYTIKCLLKTPQGRVIAEGFGHANTREKSRMRFDKNTGQYVPRDPYTENNAVLKMAEKRALVDAVLHVGALSNIFTQDLEDYAEEQGTHQQAQKGQQGQVQKAQQGSERTITDGQIRYIYKLAGGREGANAVLHKLGYDSWDKVPFSEADRAINLAKQIGQQMQKHKGQTEEVVGNDAVDEAEVVEMHQDDKDNWFTDNGEIIP